MQEVKDPKKPLIYYSLIVIAILGVLNGLIMPYLAESRVQEVDYSTFLQMVEDKEVGKVNVSSSQITFTNKDDTQCYKTGVMNDPDLVNRLDESGAQFTTDIVKEMSPMMSLLIGYVIPIVIFIALGNT